MKNELHFFDIYPKVIKVDTTKNITVKSLDRHCHFADGDGYRVTIIPMNHITADDTRPDYPVLQTIADEHKLCFSLTCYQEQEYRLRISYHDEPVCELSIYALEADLYERFPYKGNMHAHTFHSDGVESPELVAANYRRAGFDFLAITDHAWYPPSLEAIDAFSNLNLEFKLYPGEEIHAPGNKIHILNFGGKQSVNQFYRDYPEVYEQEVRTLINEMRLSQNHEDFEYASSHWVFGKINEYDGLSILAHPCWVIDGAYNIPPAQYLKFLTEPAFDALELINGGDQPAENAQQIALWHEACCRGAKVPVIGNDDSHGTVNGDWFDIGTTYVFAPSNTREALIDAMKRGLCIAVERYHGDAPRYYGSCRLVSFGAFLDREYFPLHNECCGIEGCLMAAWLRGEDHALPILNQLNGQIERLHSKYFR